MSDSSRIVPYSLKNTPALIEVLLPVQKISVEVFNERNAKSGQALTALGNFWKGRKPLILAKACILGALLPVSDNLLKDLKIFEMLMGIDLDSLERRLEEKNTRQSRELLEKLSLKDHGLSYREFAKEALRPEKCGPELFNPIWLSVNAHLGTDAHSFPELIEQLGVMRFGHRPRVADTFSGSGQIPFEAARLGCDTMASDLNPVASLLTWGAFHIVGASPSERAQLKKEQNDLFQAVSQEMEVLEIDTDGKGWKARNYLYCVEVRCPQSGWMVPLLPSRVISEDYSVIVELVPISSEKRYEILVRSGVSTEEMELAKRGTVQDEGRGTESYLVHRVDGQEYRTKISTLRGDFTRPDGSTGNRLRLWEKSDIKPRSEDIFQERLYAILWFRPKANSRRDEFEFRSVTEEDLKRERRVEEYVSTHLAEWQENGWVPDMKIESGDKTDEPIRTRGWTYWHHLFNPRQLFVGGLIRKNILCLTTFSFIQGISHNCRLARWCGNQGGFGNTKSLFDNQALNTLFNYGTRSIHGLKDFVQNEYSSFPIPPDVQRSLKTLPADQVDDEHDLYITDPPYGDAVKYEEILEFFIAWLKKNPPTEFSNWIWDSRRALAIKGEDDDFRRGMVAAYKRMTEKMSDNGLQVLMFTHQKGSIWGDMANIVWASGLHVTAAWYIVTETESALREGSYVKGTILLVLRKRTGALRTTRDDLGWEIKEEVENQINRLTGLNQETKELYQDENLFEDADFQMAGYAAALKVLTRYAFIDGKEMAQEALRPRVRNEKTLVDELIDFSVEIANRALVPQGITKPLWESLQPAERFYLKLLELESRGLKTLDNYQNFAKAFRVREFRPLMAVARANSARLKGAVEFGRNEMSEGSELFNTLLRGILYAIMELHNNIDPDLVLSHLMQNVPDYYRNKGKIEEISFYTEQKLRSIRPDEARMAGILTEIVKNQRL